MDPVLAEDYDAATRTRISLRLQLNADQYEEMTKEFKELLENG